uniref:RRM domain-containing protein n=1 Tax=Steinernema glaseri TaxID=37863 RepID=A0A1I7YHR7_9BILA
MGLQTPPWNHAFNPAPPGFFDHRSGFNLNILSPGVQPTRNDIPGTVIQAQRLPTVPQQGPSLNARLLLMLNGPLTAQQVLRSLYG